MVSRVQFSSSIWDLLYDLNPSMPRRYPERPELAGCPCSPPSRRRIHRILLELPVERVQRVLIQTVCSGHSLAKKPPKFLLSNQIIIVVEHHDSSDLRKRLLLIYCAAGNASAAVVCAAQCRHACIKGSCNLVSTAPATRTITRLSQVCADGSPLLTRQVLVSCCGGCGAPVCGSTC